MAKKNQFILAVVTVGWLSAGVLCAQTPEAPPRQPASAAVEAASSASGGATTSKDAADNLIVDQTTVADSLARFKTALLQLADKKRASDPALAELLEKAAQQMSASGAEDQLRGVVKLLESDLRRDVKEAVEKQEKVQADLTALLTLLLSQNRNNRLASEKQWLRDRIRDIEQIIRVERGLQGQAERSGELKELSKRQGELADRTKGVAKRMKEHEDASKPTEDPKSGNKDGQPKDGQPKDGQPKDGQPNDGKPKDGQPKDGKPKDGKPKDGQPGMGDPAGDDDQQQQPSAREHVERAVEKMRRAQQRLDEAKRNDAVREQEAAIADLETARAELEEILRQKREEEIEKTLAHLEARFKHMLKLQQEVRDATALLDRKPAADRGRSDEMEAGRLAQREQQIVAELDKASLLLREDGSAVAFPAAVGELREAMEVIAQLLAQNQIGASTQEQEQNVIDDLKEMIAALEKARKDLKQKKSQGARPPGQPADPPLVDAISELKMIRALQVRVNRRTIQYGEMVRKGEIPADQMQPRIRKLSAQQQKIHRIARDLHLGRNE